MPKVSRKANKMPKRCNGLTVVGGVDSVDERSQTNLLRSDNSGDEKAVDLICIGSWFWSNLVPY